MVGREYEIDCYDVIPFSVVSLFYIFQLYDAI